MNKVKYLLSVILIAIGFSFIGEFYIYYLDNFASTFYATDMYHNDAISAEQMKEDVSSAAAESNVNYFLVKHNIESALKKTITIYADEPTLSLINEESQVQQGEYQSFFSGKTTVLSEPLDEYVHNNIVQPYTFYLIGEQKNMYQFKALLVNQYGGNFPRVQNDSQESMTNILGVWGIIYIILLLFSFYDLSSSKKQVSIRVLFGESIHSIILKKVAQDVTIFSFIYISLLYIGSSIYFTDFYLLLSIGLFVLFLLVDIFLIIFQLYHLDFKSIFSNVKGSKKFLFFSYLMKVLFSIFLFFTVASFTSTIFEAIQYKNQESFFEVHKNYSYVHLDYKTSNRTLDGDPIEKGAVIRETFYANFLDSFKATQLTDLSGSLGFAYPLVLTNKNTIDYLISKIPELKNIDLEKKVYYFIPQKYQMEDLSDELNHVFQYYEQLEGNEEIFYYQEQVSELIAINEFHLNRSKVYTNPVIIFNNRDADKVDLSVARGMAKTFYAHDILYDIAADDFDAFIEQNYLMNDIVIKTNVYELYLNHLSNLKRAAILSLVLSVFFVVLDFILIRFVLELEYSINAKELTLKKTLGYTVFEKNKKIIVLSLITNLLSGITMVIIAALTEVYNFQHILPAFVVLLLFELLMIGRNINRIEKESITKILKGGSL